MNKNSKDYFNCKCEYCGKALHKAPNELRHSRTGKVYCSREHKSAGMSQQSLKNMAQKVGTDNFAKWLNQKYNVEGMNTREISKLVYGTKTNSPNIGQWLKRLNIPMRTLSESIKISWAGNNERRQEDSRRAKINLGPNSAGRKKLKEIMQTKQYRMNRSLTAKDPKVPYETREEQQEIRQSKEYTHFRNDVLKRDNYTCQVCGNTSNLIVHHLNAFRKYIDQRFSVDNGITICKECHDRFHKFAHGKGNNTKEQFQDFLNTIK